MTTTNEDILAALKRVPAGKIQVVTTIHARQSAGTSTESVEHDRVEINVTGPGAVNYAKFMQAAVDNALSKASASVDNVLASKYANLPSMPRIVCAANRLDNGMLIVGARHYDSVMHATINGLTSAGMDVNKDCDQGFIDQFGNFYTREEAWEIADFNGQIIRRVGGDGCRLYSENLY